jgi:zinc transport system substrate-binding protein
MQKNKYAATIVIVLMCVISVSFAGDSSDKLIIYTVNYPLKYFAERIGGEHAEVVFPAPADVDPAYWMPERKTVEDFQKADLILLNGAHYAQWTEKVTLPQSKMINTSRNFKNQHIKLEEAVTHSHGPGDKHDHEGIAFTTWIDFFQAALQAKAIKKALSHRKPELKSTFQKNYAYLEGDLLALDRDIKTIVANRQEQAIIASHPVYQYFARRYGLNIKSVHWEPDEQLSGAQWMELKNILRDHTAKLMIWEGKPLNVSVEKLHSIGIKSVVFDPFGNTPDEGDFLTVMRQNVENLKAVFQ